MTNEHDPAEEFAGEDLIAGARRQVAAGSVERAGMPPGEAAGDVIDRYKLLQEIGEGGMGTVWMAEQSEPVKRRVALKIIKLGMDTKEVVVRFEAERQALALMSHPNIAHVIDGGATETGRPYFVMELVKGVPITEYCDKSKAGLRERLELFAKVCEAIQHAHHKGVIHRDIKPSNVLVTLHDGVPIPKVIDFGIAKATSAELTQKTMFTQFAAIIGTPEYMAPEQAEMSGLDIDTRADVYSLGVLLYELLTGTKPFDIKTALEAGYQELLRTIREVDPAKPSTRVSTLRETASIDDGRHVNVDELSRRLRGDLDWIVMKALEKDRTRRYDTPNAFAADVARYLIGDPVDAAPPSKLYRAKKFIRRRRKSVVTAAIILVLLVAGSVGTGVGWWRTQRANEALDQALSERTAALEARTAALAGEEEQRKLAEANAEEARRELFRAEETSFLMSDLLRGLTPHVAQGADVTPFRRVLERAEERLSDGTIEDPLVAAQLRQTVGTVYFLFGLYDEASRHIPKAHAELTELLGTSHLKTYSAQLDVGRLYLMLDRDEEAERMLREVFDAVRVSHGGESTLTLLAAHSLSSYYVSRERTDDALAVLLTGPDGGRVEYDYEQREHRLHAGMLVMSFINASRYVEAQELLDELSAACDGGAGCNEEEERLQQAMRVSLAEKLGDKETAMAASRERYDRLLATHGPDHPETIVSMTEYGVNQVDARNFDEAEKLIEDALERAEQTLGADHRATLRARYALAWLRMHEGRRLKAERLYRALLEDANRVLPAGNEISTSTCRDLGMLYQELGRLEDAEAMMLAALEMTLATKSEDHSDVLGARTNLGGLYLSLGRFAEAAAQTEISRPRMLRVLGPDHQWTSNATYILANSYTRLGRDEEALPLHRDFLAAQLRALERAGDAAPAGELARMAWWLLSYEVEDARDPERALPFARAACEAAVARGDRAHFEYLDLLAQAQFATGDIEAAVASEERALELMPQGAEGWLREEFEQRLADYREALGE